MRNTPCFRDLVGVVALAGLLSCLSAQTTYVLVELDTLTGIPGTHVSDLNDAGEIVGYYLTSQQRKQGLHWADGALKSLNPLAGDTTVQPVAINNQGQIIGVSSSGSSAARAVRWTAGVPLELDATSDLMTTVTNLNDKGQIIGYRSAEVNGPRTAFVWENGVFTSFSGGAYDMVPSAINETGWVAGNLQQVNNGAPFGFFRNASFTTTIRLDGASHSQVRDMNQRAQITGYSTTAGSNSSRAFRYELVNGLGTIENLHPSNATSSSGHVIAEDGTVFGDVGMGNNWGLAAILAGENTVFLQDRTIGADEWKLSSVIAVNAKGWIAGQAFRAQTDTQSVDYLLLPRVAATSAFANLSVRANLIGGTPIIVGAVTKGGPREVLARGVGPGLAPYLPTGTTLAADPRLSIYGANETLITTNDNWGATTELIAAITATQSFAIDSESMDAAALPVLSGVASVHMTNDAAGLALLELYDNAEADADNRLINLSARYRVGTGSDVLVAGFIIEGTGTKTVLIRGVGPGLTGLGVPGALVDPQITLFDSAGNAVAQNDNWSVNLGSVFSAVGAFQLEAGSQDAAMVLPLKPGLYTVHLSGVNDTTGEGLIEVYDLDL